MSKTECIFKPQRCKKCDSLILKTEKHVCGEKPKIPKSRRLFLEIGIAFDELHAASLTPSEICHYLNQKYDSQKYTSYEIRWHMDQKPNIFAVDITRSYKTYQEKKYCYLYSDNTDNLPEKYSKVTKIRYYINPPKSKHGNVHVIKKESIHDTAKTETTLAMVYGKELAESLLKKCKELNA